MKLKPFLLPLVTLPVLAALEIKTPSARISPVLTETQTGTRLQIGNQIKEWGTITLEFAEKTPTGIIFDVVTMDPKNSTLLIKEALASLVPDLDGNKEISEDEVVHSCQACHIEKKIPLAFITSETIISSLPSQIDKAVEILLFGDAAQKVPNKKGIAL